MNLVHGVCHPNGFKSGRGAWFPIAILLKEARTDLQPQAAKLEGFGAPLENGVGDAVKALEIEAAKAL